MLMDLAVKALNENDRKRGLTERESLLLRILKLREERGEVAEAVIGWTGQNPRKGVTHTEIQVIGELADVVLTAMLAIATMTDDWQELISNTYRIKLRRIIAAVDEQSKPPVIPGLDTEAAATEGMRYE